MFDDEFARQGRLAKLRDALAPADLAVLALDADEGDIAFDALVVGLGVGLGVGLDLLNFHDSGPR